VTCTQPGCGGTIQDGYCAGCEQPVGRDRDGRPSTAQPSGNSPILGCEPNARALRFGLERTYRALARLTPDEDRRIELVDMANAIRPRTLT